MFRVSRVNWNGVKRTVFGLESNNGLHHLHPAQQKQVINAINNTVMNKKPQFFKTLLQISGIIVGTITVYSAYQVGYRKHKAFIPLYISKTKRAPHSFEVDEKVIQTVAEEQLLERLSLDNEIQNNYKLPITIAPASEFDIWVEDKDISLKGIEISPKSPFIKKVDKPLTLEKYLNGVMEPIGGKDNDFKIPVVNKQESDFDIWFLGQSELVGKNGKKAEIVYKGIFDSEHIKQAKIIRCHLIKVVDGKKKRVVLW